MPWYLKRLNEYCQECGQPAEYELRDNRNAFWGYFCGKCGKPREIAHNRELDAKKREHEKWSQTDG